MRLITPFSTFLPKDLSGLALWLDGQDSASIARNGSSQVAQWSDKSGKGNHAVQTVDANKPVYTASAISALPALKFRNAAAYSLLSSPDTASLNYTAFTQYVVFRRVTDLAAVERLAGKFSSASPANQREHCMLLLSTDEVQGNLSADGAPGVGFATASMTALNTNYIGMQRYSPTTGTIALNGTVSVNTGTIASVFNGTSPYHIGARDDGGDPFDGYIGEVLFYTRALSATENSNVMRYLSCKWKTVIA